MKNKMDLFKRMELAQDGEIIRLEKEKIYHVWQHDCPLLSGYYFSNTTTVEENPNGMHRAALWLKNKKNITIDGNGATLLIHGVITPMLFDCCENITVKNLTIDYARPTMSEFTIKKKEAQRYLLYIPEEFLFTVRGNEIVWLGEEGKDGNRFWEIPYKGDNVLSMYYDPAQEKMCMMKRAAEDLRPSVPTFSRIEQIDDRHVCVELRNEASFFPVGCSVQTRQTIRNEVGAGFLYCKNIRLEGIRIFSMNGLGLLAQFCENVAYDRVECIPKRGRTVASNADFFHFSGCKGELLIENCKAAAGHDDFINVHGTHLRIFDYDKKNRRLLVRFMHPQSWGFEAFFSHDKIELIKWDTLLPYADAEVCTVCRLNDTDVLLTLDRDLPEIEIGKDVIENVTWTASLTVRNNYFGCSGGRGILCTTRKPVLIENNIFYHICGTPLVVEDDCNFWFESGYTKEIVFRSNRVIGCGYGFDDEGGPLINFSPQVLNEDSNKPVHGALFLLNNSFKKANPKGHVFNLKYVKSVEFCGNCFDEEYKIEKVTVCDYKEKDNVVEMRG